MEPNDWEPRLHEGPLLRKLDRKDRKELNVMKLILYQEILEKLLESYGIRKIRIYLVVPEKQHKPLFWMSLFGVTLV